MGCLAARVNAVRCLSGYDCIVEEGGMIAGDEEGRVSAW